MTELLTTENLIALLTLTAMEVVLGIDNLVFISIITGKLPVGERQKAARIGIAGAVITRIGLLFSIAFLLKYNEPVIRPLGQEMSPKDIVLLVGGLFLIWKATHEMHDKVKHGLHPGAIATPVTGAGGATPATGAGGAGGAGSGGMAAKVAGRAFWGVIGQIMVIDVVFSIDSVITAVGMAKAVPVMVGAVLLSSAIMVLASGPVMRFVEKFPSIKVLALAFLLLIGVMITAEAFHHQIPRGYVYFAMAFALGVDVVQMIAERRSKVPAAH